MDFKSKKNQQLKTYHPDLSYSTPHWHDAKCRAKDLHFLPRGKCISEKRPREREDIEGGGPAGGTFKVNVNTQCSVQPVY